MAYLKLMGNLISNLTTLYTAVIESTSDQLFYKNVHHYIDFIVKTPQLAKIMDDSEIEYGKKHSEIWML
jgi:hypothetical protein